MSKRPSPALAISVAALVVALSGTGYSVAGSLITGQQIKNNSVTGLDVKEASLRTVPSATKANTAAKASSVAVSSINGNSVKNGSLGLADLFHYEVRATVPVGNVPASSCTNNLVVVPHSGDNQVAHVLVTPIYAGTNTNLSYTAEGFTLDRVNVKACNHTAAAIDEGDLVVNILVLR